MPLPRYVLFRSRTPQPVAAVTRRIAEIPHVTTTAAPPLWTVKDNATGSVVELTLAEGPLVTADIRALAADHWRNDAEGRAEIAGTDARFELRFADDANGTNLMLLVQDAVERATGGFGYDLRFKRIVVAAEGESLVLDAGPAQKAEDERLLAEIEAMSDEDLDRQMAAAGGDPAATRRAGKELAEKLSEQRALYDLIVEALARPGLVAREPRAELAKRLAAARPVPVVGGAINWVIRDRALASMSDGELQVVADEVGKWMGRGRA
jgi:hypothetical protein